jgi:hypothetical protein
MLMLLFLATVGGFNTLALTAGGWSALEWNMRVVGLTIALLVLAIAAGVAHLIL